MRFEILNYLVKNFVIVQFQYLLMKPNFHVRRVKELLLRHNKYYLYKDIDEEALNRLPLDGTPEDLPILMEDRPLPALGMAAYWERTEYQSCGSAHAHALWWHGNPPPDAFLDVITGCAGG